MFVKDEHEKDRDGHKRNNQRPVPLPTHAVRHGEISAAVSGDAGSEVTAVIAGEQRDLLAAGELPKIIDQVSWCRGLLQND